MNTTYLSKGTAVLRSIPKSIDNGYKYFNSGSWDDTFWFLENCCGKHSAVHYYFVISVFYTCLDTRDHLNSVSFGQGGSLIDLKFFMDCCVT